MPSVVQRKNPNRGRPRKPVPPVLPLVQSVAQWSARTGESRQTVRRKIKAGVYRSVQTAPGCPHKILSGEYVRHGFAQSLRDLLPP